MKNILSYLYERRPRFLFSKLHIGGRGWHAGFERNGNCWNWRPSIMRFATCTFYRFGRFFFAKDRRRIGAFATLALSCILLPACALTPTAEESSVVAPVGTSLLPPAMVAKVKALVAANPAAKPYLVTVANALQSISGAEKRLPSPDSTLGTLVSWSEWIPEVGGYVSDFDKIYRAYYGTIPATSAALSQLAEIVRSST